MLNFIKNIGPAEIVLILIILVAVFGRKVLISLGRTTGESVKEIKNIKKTFTESLEDRNKEENEGGAKKI
jgi:Sec-independent protein translocase protein TatA